MKYPRLFSVERSPVRRNNEEKVIIVFISTVNSVKNIEFYLVISAKRCIFAPKSIENNVQIN